MTLAPSPEGVGRVFDVRPTPSRRTAFRWGLTVVGLGVGLTACSPPGPVLVCRHQRTGEEYARFPIAEGSRITHSWIHSIELSRWTDTFEFDGTLLQLVETRFKQYGAGMPLDEGTVRMEDGWVVIEDIDRTFEAITWIHSHRVEYRIGIDDREDAIDPHELPDNEPLELRPI